MAPKSKVQFAKIRSESEEKILSSALELFAEQGYKSTSISQIAKHAGISKGLMYNYFESKEALLSNIISNAINAGMDLVDQALEDRPLPEDEVEHLVMDSIDFVIANFKLMKLLAMLSLQKQVLESMGDIMTGKREQMIAKGVELFTKLGSPTPFESAMLLGASMDGLMLYYIHMEDQFPIREMGRILVKTFTDKHSVHRGSGAVDLETEK